MPVNTGKVEGRRKLDYKSLTEFLADADRASAGPTAVLGNWSPGQIFEHLAISFNRSIDGFTFSFPWYFRLMAKTFKKQLLAGHMPPGFKLSSQAAETMEPKPISTEQGLANLHAAVSRVESESKRTEHPMFGKLSKDEWNQVYLKHASLHMSFLVPE